MDDVLRYLDFADEDGNIDTEGDVEARTRIMEAMLRWRCGVPTAPDTICKFSSRLVSSAIFHIDARYRVLSIPDKRPLCYAELPASFLHR